MSDSRGLRFDYSVVSLLALSVIAFWRFVPEAFDLVKAVVVVVAGPLTLIVAVLTQRRRVISGQDPVPYLIASIVLALSISVFVGHQVNLALVGQEQRFTGYFLWVSSFLVAASVYLWSSGEFPRRLLNALCIAGGIFSFYGFIQAFDRDPFEWNIQSFSASNTFSTQGNPNFASWTCGVVFVAAFFVSQRSRRSAFLLFPLLASQLFVSDLTASIQGIAAIGFFGLLLIVASCWSGDDMAGGSQLVSGVVILAGSGFLELQGGGRGETLLLSFAIGAVVALTTALPLRMTRLARRVSVASGLVLASGGILFLNVQLRQRLGDQFGERSAFYRAALRMFAESPIYGHGLERYGRIFPSYRPAWHAERLPESLSSSAHSIWLGLGVAGGALLLVPFLGLGMVALKRSFPRAVAANVDANHRAVAYLCAVVVVGWLVAVEQASTIFISVVILALAAVRRDAPMTSKALRSKIGITTCASGLLVLSLVLSIRWLDGSRSQNEAYRELFANGNVDEGLRLLDKAVSWGPVPAQARGVRANIYAQLGDSERALEDARATVEAFEYTGSATVENARIMIQFGDVDEARVVLLKAIEKNPGNFGLISEAQDLLDQLP